MIGVMVGSSRKGRGFRPTYSAPVCLGLVGLSLPVITASETFWPLALSAVAAALSIAGLRALVGPHKTAAVSLAAAVVTTSIATVFQGGWFLLPAALAFLAVELHARSQTAA